METIGVIFYAVGLFLVGVVFIGFPEKVIRFIFGATTTNIPEEVKPRAACIMQVTGFISLLMLIILLLGLWLKN